MRKKYLASVVWIFFLLLIYACNKNKPVSEGRIEYKVTLVNPSKNILDLEAMIPKKMTLQFKDNKSVFSLNSEKGILSTSFISNPENKTNTIILKILNQKLVAVQNAFDIERENNQYALKYIPTNETKTIAGYTCHKVHVISENKKHQEFDIYYTNDIDLKDSNFATPFHKIEGVLLEYQYERFGYELKFTATKVIAEAISDETFTYTSDHKKISSKEMNDLFKSFQP